MKKSLYLIALLLIGLSLFATPASAQLNCSGGCGSGGSGSGTVNTGTAGEVAYYAAGGTAVDGMYPPLTQTHATDTTLTPDMHASTTYIEAALASAITIGAPTNVAHAGQTILFILRDNGTSRAITWNAIYRGSPPPTAATTINTWLYIVYAYNATDNKWDATYDSGQPGVPVIPDTGASNNFLTAIDSTGAISKARPTCGNLSDSGGGCSQTYATGTTTSSATISPGTGNHIFYSVTALATGITAINAPGGSPAAGDTLMLTIKDTGSTQTITGWNAIYYAGATIAFPTATTGGSILSMVFVYNPINSKYILQAVLDTN